MISMAIERQFVKDGIKKSDIEEFLSKEFVRAGYSHSDIQHTPVATHITVFAQRPGMVIGKGGKNIDAITEMIKQKFGIQNPQLEVREVEIPELDANVVSSEIANAIERGLNYKRVVNIMIQNIMRRGAAGVAIRVGGKFGGDMSRIEKFSAGYLKYAGEEADTEVRKSYATALVKAGAIGIQVKILPTMPKEIEISRRLLASVPTGGKEEIKAEIEKKTEDETEQSENK